MPQQPVRTETSTLCAGHARKLVSFDQQFDPGYQGAYGIMAEVESHPFDLDTMLFMDWRDDHTQVGHVWVMCRSAGCRLHQLAWSAFKLLKVSKQAVCGML